MPWTCLHCNTQSDLGYNVCSSCKTPRPGAESPLAALREPREPSEPLQISLGRILGGVACIACTFAFVSRIGPILFEAGPHGNFRPVAFSTGLVACLGVTVGTIRNGHYGFVVGAFAGAIAGWLLPVVLGLLYFLYLLVTGQDIMPVPS